MTNAPCSGGSRRPRTRATVRLLVVLVGVACVTTTTRYFVPSTQNPIYRPEQATPVLAEYVRLQCPAFRKAGRPDAGEVHLSVDVDTAGFATRATLTRGSGDELLDGVFGTVAAQLVFAPDRERRRRTRQERIIVDYRCAGDSAAVVKFR